MTTIYLIRHAEAEGNLYRIAQGQYDSNLSDRGWHQVRALERRFAEIPVDAVYSSDLYRTCATASAICIPKHLPLHRWKHLREICVGRWEQRTWGDIYHEDPEQFRNFFSAPDKWKVEGAETPWEVQARVTRALLEIAAEHDGKTVAVFSHGCAIRLALAHMQGCPVAEVCSRTPLGVNTAISKLEGDGSGLRVVFRDDDRHLHTAEYLACAGEGRHPNGLETGLRFEALRLPDHEAFLRSLMADVWQELGLPHPFDVRRLTADAAHRHTLLGFLGDEPAGLVQLGPAAGWISLLCVRRELRRKGLGIQLVGQAVQWTREMGGEEVFAMPPAGADPAFFRESGFSAQQGVWTKRIAFDPAILAL